MDQGLVGEELAPNIIRRTVAFEILPTHNESSICQCCQCAFPVHESRGIHLKELIPFVARGFETMHINGRHAFIWDLPGDHEPTVFHGRSNRMSQICWRGFSNLEFIADFDTS